MYGGLIQVSIHALLAECDTLGTYDCVIQLSFNPRTPCGVRQIMNNQIKLKDTVSIHALLAECDNPGCRMTNCYLVSIHALLAECDPRTTKTKTKTKSFNPRTPCGVRLTFSGARETAHGFQSTHSLRSATWLFALSTDKLVVSIHALLAECDEATGSKLTLLVRFQSTHSLRSATAPNLIHCYSTKQIILCANLPKKTVIARLLFLSIYLSIFYSQCITPIADLPGNSCELEVGAQAMFNSL